VANWIFAHTVHVVRSKLHFVLEKIMGEDLGHVFLRLKIRGSRCFGDIGGLRSLLPSLWLAAYTTACTVPYNLRCADSDRLIVNLDV